MASLTLLELPAELVAAIIDVVHPADHLSLALTSKYLYDLSEEVLAYHRECCRQYRLCSDLLPLTMPKLMRTIFYDPIAAWHIRDLEFWGLRSHWDSWKTWHSFDYAKMIWNDGLDYVLVDASGIGKAGKVLSQEDTQLFAESFRRYMGYEVLIHDSWADMMMSGNEEILKFLLLGMAPRLRSVTFSTYSPGGNNSISPPTGFLSKGIEVMPKRSPTVLWPPGFQSLRSISIGVCHSFAPDWTSYTYYFYMVSPLFGLPSLNSIWLDGPRATANPHIARHMIPRKSSSVKHVRISGSRLDMDEITEMISGVTDLKSFIFSTVDRDCDVITVLQSCHAESLEFLDMIGADTHQCGYEGRLSRFCLWSLMPFKNLRFVVVDVMVLLIQHLDRVQVQGYGGVVKFMPSRHIERLDLVSMLPRSLEVIIFTTSDSPYSVDVEMAKAIDHIVAKSVKGKTHERLRAIFFQMPVVEGNEEGSPLRDNTGVRDREGFTKTCAAGHEQGIEVLTRWTHTLTQMRQRREMIGVPRPMHDERIDKLATDVRNDVAGFRKLAIQAQKEIEELTANYSRDGAVSNF